MLVAIECLPLVTMLVVLPQQGFMRAIAASMIATIVSFALSWTIDKRIPKFGLFSSVLVILLSALTLVSNNPDYIIFLDTLGTFGFAALLLSGRYYNVLFLKIFFTRYFAITDTAWRILTARWALFFIMFGLANEYMRLVHSPEAWVYFNVFGVLATMLFGTYQFTLSRRYRLPDASPWGLRIQ